MKIKSAKDSGHYRLRKTEGQGGTLISIRIMLSLAAAISHCSPDALTFLETQDGQSRSPNVLGNLIRRCCDTAGLPECAAPGLRKAVARSFAEAGALAKEIAFVTGHKTLAEVRRYTDAADRVHLADQAFDKLSERTMPQQKVVNFPIMRGEPSSISLKENKK